MSPGSKPSENSFACAAACSGVNPFFWSDLLQPGDNLLRDDFAEPLAEVGQGNAASFVEPHAKFPVVRCPHEQQHVGRRRVGGREADIPHGDVHLALGLFVDHLQDLDRGLPGQLVLGTGRGPETEHELAGIDLRKQFVADLPAHEPENQSAAGQVSGHRDPAELGNPLDEAPEGRQDAVEERDLVRVVPSVPQQPDREHGDQRAGEQVRGDHREAHGQRQRHEQRADGLLHDERGNEHRQHAEHGQEAGRGRGRAGPPRRPGHGVRMEHLGMGVFNRDHGLVHEDADGQGQPAQRHDVERVAREP